MAKPKTNKPSLLRDEKGLTTVEYIIVLALIAVVGFAIWRQFGATVVRNVQGADSVLGDLPTNTGEGTDPPPVP